MHVATPSAERRGLSASSYRVIAWLAFASLYIIIVTGALVRLTGSGLGCVDWPACNEQQFVDVSTPHAAIEQVNRLFTGVVAASVIAAMLAAFAVRPRDRRMIRLAFLMVVGVVGQVVLGGVVVLTGLHPLSNMAHFLLSIVLMTWAYWLVAPTLARDRHTVARNPWRNLLAVRSWSLQRSNRLVTLGRVVILLTAVAIVTGTVVTGAGPHAGDESSPRFDYAIRAVAKVHGASVIATVAVILCLGLAIRQAGAARKLQNTFEGFLFLAVLQGGLGYLQYFTGVPVLLVAVHITLSVAVWLGALHLWRAIPRHPMPA
jgi:cytochrome c oxidase assembly protein subunit 15